MNRISLYSATGVFIGLRRDRQAAKLIKLGQAVWVTDNLTLQLLHYTDAELAAEASRQNRRANADRSDEIEHKGEWRVVQPTPGKAAPSGWQLRHPRVNEVLYAPETL